MNRLLAATACAAFALATVSEARAINRDCPRGQSWDPNQGSCIKKRRAKKKSPEEKYYEAVEHLEGTAKRPKPKRGISLLKQACKARHPQSCTLLGFLYLNARSVEFNGKVSLDFYDKACRLADPNGCLGAAEVHSRGVLGKIDHGKSRGFLESACKLKNGKGCYNLAEKYANALGVAQDKRRAQSLYTTAFGLLKDDCARKVGPSCHLLGLSYFHGRGTKKELRRAFQAFRNGCQAGSGDACYQVGASYQFGNGTSSDNEKALDFYDKACIKYDSASGCHDAGVLIALGKTKSRGNAVLTRYGERACQLDGRQCDLIAHLLATGKAGNEDQPQASKWYVVACDKGNDVACSSAGHRAFAGTGMAKDLPRALTMWQRSCELGHAPACKDLGEQLYSGEHTKKDQKRAFELFHLGCIRDDASSCHWGGFAIERGTDGSGKNNPSGAVIYYKTACNLGESGGCVDLGKLHRDGNGVDKNPMEAKAMFDKACEMGFSNGCVELGQLHYRGDGLPKDEVLSGQAFLRACKLGVKQECYWIDQLFKNGKANATQRANAVKALEAACSGKGRNDNACLVLAGLYAYGGYIADKNGRRAFTLYKEGCDRKVKDACLLLPHMYAKGIGVVKDSKQAKAMFTEQCNGDSPASCTWLGAQLWQEKEFEQAVSLYQRACQDKNPQACNGLGFAHYIAKGARWDMDEAHKYFAMSCELGEPIACANMGELYQYGIAVDRDLDKAFANYQKGCTPTISAGCTALGKFYERGLGGADKDLARAEAEYKRGCSEQFVHSGEACRALAEHYQSTGKAGPSKIAALFQKAFDMSKESAKTNPHGKYLLGTFYRDGISVVAAPAKAVEYFAAACDGYDPLGCLNAGVMYMGKSGLDADYEAANVRFSRACAAGIADACTRAEAAKKLIGTDTGTDADTGKTGLPLEPKPKSGCFCTTTHSGHHNRGGFLGGLIAIAMCGVFIRRRRHPPCA